MEQESSRRISTWVKPKVSGERGRLLNWWSISENRSRITIMEAVLETYTQQSRAIENSEDEASSVVKRALLGPPAEPLTDLDFPSLDMQIPAYGGWGDGFGLRKDLVDEFMEEWQKNGGNISDDFAVAFDSALYLYAWQKSRDVQ